MQALLALLVLPAIPAKTAKQVNRVPKVPKDLQAQQEEMANPARPVLPARLDLLERKVFVRNIAPWTAAFSSRTERGDKRPINWSFLVMDYRIQTRLAAWLKSGLTILEYGVYCFERTPALVPWF